MFAVLVLNVLIRFVTAGGCKNMNGLCPREAPCCNFDWCGNGPVFCGGGCESWNSFPGACWNRPGCFNQTISNFADVTKPLSVYSPNSGTELTMDEGTPFVRYGSIDLLLVQTNRVTPDGRFIGAGSRVSSVRYFTYGKVTTRLKMAPGSGVVTAFILMSDEKDEIDFEWVGKDTYSVQTNYYYRGIIDYRHGMTHPVDVDLSQGFHNYTIDWNKDRIVWLIDGRELRTLTVSIAAANQSGYPSTPTRAQFSIWDGAAGADGTREWAGTTYWNTTNKYVATISGVTFECLSNETPDDNNSHTTLKKKKVQNDQLNSGASLRAFIVWMVLSAIVAF